MNQDPGWSTGFGLDEEGAVIDPRNRDAFMSGLPAATSTTTSGRVGMARAYGYGATMGAWCTDYLAYWAGHDGMVRHTKATSAGRPSRVT